VPDLYRLGSLIAAGIPTLAGSDAPYGPINPWQVIHAAMTRTTQEGAVIGGGEAVTLHQALRLFSADQPIQPGDPADLCLLGTPLSTIAQGWTGNPVDMTFIGGNPITSD
jgi:predicted amidohydrolase YtcJ